MPNSLNARLKKLAFQKVLSSEDLCRILVIPKDATNGDVIKSLVGEDKIYSYVHDVQIVDKVNSSLCAEVVAEFSKDWWNSKFER